MKLKRIAALLTAGLLTLNCTAALAAKKNEKKDADAMDVPAILQATDEKGTVNVYHWWTAGGEKDAIESVVKGFSDTYTKVKAKSNAIPGGAGGAMVMKVKVLQQAGKSPEAFQAHPGQEIEPYLNSNMLLNLDKVWEYGQLSQRALPGLNGKVCVFAAPLSCMALALFGVGARTDAMALARWLYAAQGALLAALMLQNGKKRGLLRA